MTALFGPTDAIDRARALREAGASGVFTFEGPHDVFAPLTLAVDGRRPGSDDQRGNRFPAQPDPAGSPGHTTTSCSAKGRFTLGLGTQVRAQIEKRYGTDFDKPVARMRELVGALRAIFATWKTGERLDFRGEFYRHTLMTPTFNPGPNPFGPPPIYVGALGPRLTKATAEVADGLLVMPFGSSEVPARVDDARGARRAGRGGAFASRTSRSCRRSSLSAGEDHSATRRLLSFYGSTPAYRPVLDIHGWGDLQPELNAMSKQGRWQEMAGLIDDEILHTIAACGSPDRDCGAYPRPGRRRVRHRLPVSAGPDRPGRLAAIVDELT